MVRGHRYAKLDPRFSDREGVMSHVDHTIPPYLIGLRANPSLIGPFGQEGPKKFQGKCQKIAECAARRWIFFSYLPQQPKVYQKGVGCCFTTITKAPRSGADFFLSHYRRPLSNRIDFGSKWANPCYWGGYAFWVRKDLFCS